MIKAEGSIEVSFELKYLLISKKLGKILNFISEKTPITKIINAILNFTINLYMLQVF
jgi:hypothetical protein